MNYAEPLRGTALVTGGSRGIGRAIVIEAARRGYDVRFTYRDHDAARETAQEAVGLPGRVEGIAVELANRAAVEKLADAASNWDGLSLLVNNAGVILGGELESVSDSQWDVSLSVNLTAPFLLAQRLSRVLARSGGSIVNISSNGGVSGSMLGAPYGATKTAVIGLTMTLARELAPDVRVNAIAPGSTATDMYGELSEDLRAEFEAATPLGRAAEPSEVARTTLDVAGWTYVTGQTIVVDGGTVMR